MGPTSSSATAGGSSSSTGTASDSTGMPGVGCACAEEIFWGGYFTCEEGTRCGEFWACADAGGGGTTTTGGNGTTTAGGSSSSSSSSGSTTGGGCGDDGSGNDGVIACVLDGFAGGDHFSFHQVDSGSGDSQFEQGTHFYVQTDGTVLVASYTLEDLCAYVGPAQTLAAPDLDAIADCGDLADAHTQFSCVVDIVLDAQELEACYDEMEDCKA